MNNEERAHDIAIMLTNFYLNNPDNINNEFNGIISKDESLIDGPYNLYKKIYNTIAKYTYEDFKNSDEL